MSGLHVRPAVLEKESVVIYVLVMESEVYGHSEFTYSTREDRMAGFSRLAMEIQKHQAEDGILRTVTLEDRADTHLDETLGLFDEPAQK